MGERSETPDQGGQASRGEPKAPAVDPKHRARTAGTNRDFDESGESANQGHGHPREPGETGGA